MGKAILIFHNRAAIANKTKVQWGWIVELHALHDFKAVAQVGQQLGEHNAESVDEHAILDVAQLLGQSSPP